MPEDGPVEDGAFSTTDSQANTPKRSSVALPPTNEETFHIVEHDEVQPAIDDVPNIPDDPTASTTFLPISRVPTIVRVPDSDVPPPVPEKPSTVHKRNVSAATVVPPVSDDKTHPEEWVQVPNGDLSKRKSFPGSDISQPESVLAGGRNSLITRADLLRQQAEEEEKIRAHLENELKKLKAAGNVKDAFLLKADIDEAESRAKRLHGQAARRYFHGML
jgi:hypothetical protein